MAETQIKIPFTCKWSDDGKTLVLKGDLDGSYESSEVSRKALAEVIKSEDTFNIDATEARIVPDGVTTWIEAVEEALSDEHSKAKLHYKESLLCDLLQMDSRYKHAGSTFDPSEFLTDTSSEERQPDDKHRI